MANFTDNTTQLQNLLAKVDALPEAGNGELVLQSKSIDPTESVQLVTPNSGYNGLSQVMVGAISKVYIGSEVLKKSAQTYMPGVNNQTIASGQYLTGAQTIKGDANLLAGNIKSGVNIFGVIGSYEGSGSSGGVAVETCTVTITSNCIDTYFYYLSYYDGGYHFESSHGVNVTLNNVVCNSMIYVIYSSMSVAVSPIVGNFLTVSYGFLYGGNSIGIGIVPTDTNGGTVKITVDSSDW